MKKIILYVLVVFTVSCGQSKNENKTIKETTTYYLVRHAEKDTIPVDNPKLLASGEKRAQNLAAFFNNKTLDAVYSTDYTRTINTAYPTAKAQNLETIIYNPTTINYKTFLKETKGKNVFVVGHSNTIPGFVNSIINANAYEEIDESIYNRMYVVTITDSKIKHELKMLD
ncbi:phosphoglycerate mutase family protein [Lacinutrix sp.]|uniref:phosphoglycerate mutase family protein n=1 Tax=Lacinutrix sp. TaxID=1937692 RepID=UPI00262FD480|nr:phosphoglycerate mutase family protein [Lacinutrix sp.]MDG1715195.1 phosphoglycerate mutase family protein [Lacinutrix sp.]